MTPSGAKFLISHRLFIAWLPGVTARRRGPTEPIEGSLSRYVEGKTQVLHGRSGLRRVMPVTVALQVCVRGEPQMYAHATGVYLFYEGLRPLAQHRPSRAGWSQEAYVCIIS